MAILVMSGQEHDKETNVGEDPKKEEEEPSKEKGKKPMVKEPNHKKEDKEDEVQSKDMPC